MCSDPVLSQKSYVIRGLKRNTYQVEVQLTATYLTNGRMVRVNVCFTVTVSDFVCVLFVNEGGNYGFEEGAELQVK